MGKPTGFIEWQRLLPAKRPASERVADYREIGDLYPSAEAEQQAGRCIDCGVPFCHQGCPLGNPIPDFNDAVYHGRWREAYEALSSTNNFPDFTGRICPAPCEAACVLSIDRSPVTIEQLEKEIIERAFAEGWVRPDRCAAESGKRVAVVGSGPAGLAAAAQLRRAGHAVTVLERSDKVGGLLRYGIPDFKMDKAVLDRRLEVLRANGVVFETCVDVGGWRTWRSVIDEHDAVVLALGATRARDLEVPGRDLDGVIFAMDYLEAQNRVVASGTEARSPIDVRGQRVVILGGGDTGSDCLGTAHRQGAAEVTQLELMPAPPESRAAGNPWPEWPMIFRTSSSQEEGGARRFARLTKALEGEGGRLTAMHLVGVELVTAPDGRSAIRELPGTEERVEVDRLILAMGFVGPETGSLCAELGLALDRRGAIATPSPYQTSEAKVFCAGDAMRGASLVVWAISDGREAAREVDAFLMGRPSRLPTRGRHQPWSGR